MITQPSLSALSSIKLDDVSASILAAADHRSVGDPIWRRRKGHELSTILALTQIAPYRLKLLTLDMESKDLRMVLALHCPVPLCPDANGPLRRSTDDVVVLGVMYPREILLQPLPGTRFVEVLKPAEVFHPNVSASQVQTICLGATLPRGIPLTEIILLAYVSLSLQLITVDRFDPLGVLNGDAARWYEANPNSYPLTREPFLRKNTSPTSTSRSEAKLETGGGEA